MDISYGRPSQGLANKSAKGIACLILMSRPENPSASARTSSSRWLRLERNRARIGIQAPRDIAVDREEIAEEEERGIEPPRDDAEPESSVRRTPTGLT